MKTTAMPVLLAVAAAGFASSGLAAQEDKSLLQSVRLPETWYGPKLTLEDLKGRVVLIEYWGRN